MKNDIVNEYWTDWIGLCPSAPKILASLKAMGESPRNDHIAFRTLRDPKVGINVLSEPFVKMGYKPMGEYHFEQKKLYAIHLERESQDPKIFISELLLSNFSKGLQSQMQECMKTISLGNKPLGLMGRPWSFSLKAYETLYAESEYAAWVYAFGFRANHFTISINSLKILRDIPLMNNWLKDNGYKLNDSGGEIKGTESDMLIQSSIKSDHVILRDDSSEKDCKIPGCYLEFAHRFPDKNGVLYQGFVAKSADKIFESTSK